MVSRIKFSYTYNWLLNIAVLNIIIITINIKKSPKIFY